MKTDSEIKDFISKRISELDAKYETDPRYNGDRRHMDADDLLLDVINKLGYRELFEWFAELYKVYYEEDIKSQ